MTNRVALWLAAIIVAAICVDISLGLGGTLFLGRKFLQLVTWVQFWR